MKSGLSPTVGFCDVRDTYDLYAAMWQKPEILPSSSSCHSGGHVSVPCGLTLQACHNQGLTSLETFEHMLWIVKDSILIYTFPPPPKINYSWGFSMGGDSKHQHSAPGCPQTWVAGAAAWKLTFPQCLKDLSSHIKLRGHRAVPSGLFRRHSLSSLKTLEVAGPSCHRVTLGGVQAPRQTWGCSSFNRWWKEVLTHPRDHFLTCKWGVWTQSHWRPLWLKSYTPSTNLKESVDFLFPLLKHIQHGLRG